jgi:hypothetical protein
MVSNFLDFKAIFSSLNDPPGIYTIKETMLRSKFEINSDKSVLTISGPKAANGEYLY